jgi:Arylsulfotransferase (ASST)
MRSRWFVVAGAVPMALAVAAAALALGGPPAKRAQASVSAFPAPGTVSATPRTQISLRGVAPGAVGTVSVNGSKSGRVAGRIQAHSDGNGVSFLPNERLSGGERITVRTGLAVQAGRNGDYSFTIGRRPRARGIRDDPVPLPPLPPGNFETFRSQPRMQAPIVRITKPAVGTAAGKILISPVSIKDSPTPDGPMIVDDRGDLVWFSQRQRSRKLFDFQMQRYKGQPVLSWWEGRFAQGWGYGESIIVDQSYKEVARVRAGNGYRGDLHDMIITPQNTAIVMAYDRVRRDLRGVGGRSDGVVLDNVLQEIDLETGLVMFEWHSLGEVAMDDSVVPPPPGRTWDYFHINSVELDSTDGNLIISARNTCALYKLDRRTGDLIWRLGGEGNDFKMGEGSKFCFQHDARRVSPGVLSLFDNAAGPPALRKASRAILLNVDEQAKTVSLRRAFKHPGGFLAPNQGSMRVLANGNVFVGWGAFPVFSEFSPQGAFLFNGRLTRGKGSYRAVRADWTARPSEPPRAATQRRGDRLAVWASWNGATEVASWEVLAGASADALTRVSEGRRTGFETLLSAPGTAQFVAVRALDASGGVLGSSAAVRAAR